MVNFQMLEVMSMGKYLDFLSEAVDKNPWTIRNVKVHVIQGPDTIAQADLEPGETIADTAARAVNGALMNEGIKIVGILSNPCLTQDYDHHLTLQNIHVYCGSGTTDETDAASYLPFDSQSKGIYFEDARALSSAASSDPYWATIRSRIGHRSLILPATAALIFNSKREVLLARGPNRAEWMIPGGLVEVDEFLTQTVVRECKEETGLEVSPVKLLGAYTGSHFAMTYPNGDVVQIVSFPFIVRVLGGALKPIDFEVSELRFFNVDSLPKLIGDNWYQLIFDGIKEAFQ